MMAAVQRPIRPHSVFLGAAVVTAALALASCSAAPGGNNESREHFRASDYGVPASPRVVNAGQRVPRGGGRDMVGKPYQVAGRTYVPREDPNYTAVGMASWYGSAFHGRRTANGEVYDMNGLSAAHPTMPLPSYARVTNTSTGASVVVRVNDRGPFHSNRVIDVSQRTAEMIGIRQAGVAQVRVEYLGRARLDGRDERMLMASYQAPGRRAAQSDTMFAAARPETRAEAVQVAAAQPRREAPVQMAALRADRTAAQTPEYDPFADGAADAMFAVTPAAIDGEDPLTRLLEQGEARSYAPLRQMTPAQIAASNLAMGRLRTSHVADTDTALVQVGVFGNHANAARIAGLLGSYGDVTTTELTSDGRTLWSVRVAVSAATADTVVAAARGAGADGAYRLD